jgi:hypothetical protein
MKIEDLASSLREVEAVHGSDAVTLRSAVIRAAKQYSRSRYALGKALTLYKQELPHGAWAPAVSLISKRLQLSDRTLREIMSGYRQTLPLPPSVIDELKRAGIDPVSGRGRKVVSILRDADLTTPSQAVEFATRKLSGAFKSPMPAGTVTPTKDELVIYKVRLAIRTALSNVPPNRKLSILNTAIAEEVYASIGAVPPFTVTPVRPTLDLMGMKRIDSDAINRQEAA